MDGSPGWCRRVRPPGTGHLRAPVAGRSRPGPRYNRRGTAGRCRERTDHRRDGAPTRRRLDAGTLSTLVAFAGLAVVPTVLSVSVLDAGLSSLVVVGPLVGSFPVACALEAVGGWFGVRLSLTVVPPSADEVQAG